jgi:hypothetical protein
MLKAQEKIKTLSRQGAKAAKGYSVFESFALRLGEICRMIE